jgi:hypothetical protein
MMVRYDHERGNIEENAINFLRQISLQITFIAIPCAIELSRPSFVHNSAQP